MSDLPGAPVHPLEIDAVECSPLGREKVVVRLTGRWSARRRSADGRALLVVEADGRRHRFPAIPEPRRARIGRPGTWAASFALPSSLEPHLGEQLSLWLGDVSIPLPPLSYVEGDSPDGRAKPSQREPTRGEADAPPPEHDPALPLPGGDQLPSAPRQPNGDPPVELVQETISALRTELQERAASEAHIRGVLARTQAELESRLASQARLESVQAELRVELDQLSELLQRESARREEVESKAVVMAAQVADLQDQLHELTAERDAAAAQARGVLEDLDRAEHEASGLREELSQLRAAAEQERAARERAEVREQELTAQLGQLRGELAETLVMRDAARGEAAALRAELDRLGAELAIAQQDTTTRDAELGEAEALLAEARSLTARFTARRSSQGADAEVE